MEEVNLSSKLGSNIITYYIGKSQLEIEPGYYNFTLEFVEEISENYGSYRQKINIDSYPFGKLKMSDIILASTIDMLDKKSGNEQFNLRTISNPRRIFHKEQLMCIYLEIYNLMLNTEQITNFKVEYKLIEEPKIKKSLISKIISDIKKILRIGGNGRHEISSTYKYKGSNSTEKIQLSIDMSATKVGFYTLIVTTTDLNNNEQVSKNIRLGIGDTYVNYFF
jgi:hypothetical protein